MGSSFLAQSTHVLKPENVKVDDQILKLPSHTIKQYKYSCAINIDFNGFISLLVKNYMSMC